MWPDGLYLCPVLFHINFLLIMLQVLIIGHIGAQAEFKAFKDGRGEFLSFRVAHREAWRDESGQQHESTQWVDVVMSCKGGRPPVAEFLQAGQLVYVSGSMSLRVFSSAKDRCMKAGCTINARDVQLLGAKPDPVPRQLLDEAGVVFPVSKLYRSDAAKDCVLHDSHGRLYSVDANGFVNPIGTSSGVVTNESQGDDLF